MIQGFKDFIARGNAVDMAVGVLIAGAFGGIVTALNEYVLMPLIAAIFGKPNFDHIWTIDINGATILPGTIITAVINFLIIAAALYFFVVVPLNKINRTPEEVEAKTDEAVLLEEIRDLLQTKQI